MVSGLNGLGFRVLGFVFFCIYGCMSLGLRNSIGIVKGAHWSQP